MMMDMVERVARAICLKSDDDPDRLEPGNVPYCDENGDEVEHTDGRIRGMSAFYAWRQSVPAARAAIEAMRNPTPEIMNAVVAHIDGSKTIDGAGGWDWSVLHTVAIDAALGGKVG